LEIIIDGYRELVIVEGNETLENVLEGIKKWVTENKRVITKILLEGKPLEEDKKEKIRRKKVKEFKTLELFTSSPWQLAINALEEIEYHLPRLAESLERVSSLIQEAEYGRAFSLLTNCIDVWDGINNAFKKIEKILALDYNQIFIKGERLKEKIEKFIRLLEEANKAIKNNDLLTLADILEYEFVPQIKEETEIVKKIAAAAYQHLN